MNYEFDYLSEDIKEDRIQEATKKGFYIKKIRFSGFWSQGDGASWSGYIDLLEWIPLNKDKFSERLVNILLFLIESEYIEKYIDIVFNDLRNCHPYTMDTDLRLEYIQDPRKYEDEPKEYIEDGILEGENICDLLDELYSNFDNIKEIILSDCRDYSIDIYRELEALYDSLDEGE
jgi:hypothetical protein